MSSEVYRNSGELYRNSLNRIVIRQKRPESYRKSGFGQAELYRNCFGEVGLRPYADRGYRAYRNPTKGVFTSFKYPLHLVGGISAVSHMLDDCLVWHRVHVNGLLYHPVE